MTKPKRRWDWPQIALVAVVGSLGIAALVALEVTWEKLAAVPLEQWTLIASALAGVVGTLVAAFRRPITEPAVVRIARTVEAELTAAGARERSTPPAPPGDA